MTTETTSNPAPLFDNDGLTEAGAALAETAGLRVDADAYGAAYLPELDEQIEALQAEAAEHGDEEQVALCARALNGDTDAQGACLRVLADAAAMDDGE